MKHKIFLIGLMSLLSMSFLSGCSNDNTQHLDNLKDFVESNFEEGKEEEEVKLKTYSYLDAIDSSILSNYEIVNSYDSSEASDLGVVVLKNKTGHIGFYSLTHCKFIEKCSYYQDWVNYEFDNANGVLVIKIDYEGTTKIIDNLGNILYNGPQVSNWNSESRTYNSVLYLKLRVNSTNYYFSYLNGVAEETFFYPDREALEPEEPEIPDEDDKPTPEVGDLFKGNIIDLEKYGNDGYYLDSNDRGIVTLFESETNKSINTFYIPRNSQPILTGKYIYYQKVYPLSEDSEKFSYYNQDLKYALTTIKIDMFSGTQSTIDYNYIIHSAIPCKNNEGLYKNSIAEISAINEYKVLDESRTVVIDEELNVLKDYTGLQPNSFVKLTNGNYYNKSTGILYDSEMNVLTYLNYMNPVFFEKSNIFLGRVDGYYGLVNNEGKLITNFEYDDITYNKSANYVILEKKGLHYLFNLNSESVEKTFTNCHVRNLSNSGSNQLYAFEDKNKVEFVTLFDGVIKSINGSYNFERSDFISATNDYMALLVEYSKKNDLSPTLSMMNIVFKYGSDTINLKTNGVEKQNVEKTGTNWKDAIPVTAGMSGVHVRPNGNSTYLSFKPNITGLYNFAQASTSEVYPSNIYVLRNTSGNQNLDNASLENIGFIDSTKALLEAYKTYYITINNLNYGGSDYIKFKINLESEAKNFTSNNEYIPYNNGSQMRKLAPQQSGYYKLDLSASNYTVYKFVNGRSQTVSLNTEMYNGGYVFYFDISNYSSLYFVFNNVSQYNQSSSFRLVQFNSNAIPALNSSETINVKPSEKIIRSYYCNKTGYYSLNSTSSNLVAKIVKINTMGQFVEVEKQYMNSNYYYNLQSYTKYYVLVSNNYSNIYSTTLSVTLYQ